MFKIFQQNLPTSVFDFCKKVHEHGGSAWIVGGWVRDQLLKIESISDIDIEIFYLPYDVIKKLCKSICQEEFPKFGVFKCEGMDLSLPRIEFCTGKRYNSFKTILLPHLSFHKAALRRDFTVNTLAWNPIKHEFLDPFNGVDALKTKQLYPVSKRFVEDSYRVLRAAQLIARFGFTPTEPLFRLIAQMKSPVLSPKHIKQTFDCLSFAPNKDAAWQFLEQIHWSRFLR